MADRIFAGLLLIVAIGYTYMAFAVIRAPFQYDPLGPETWPQILGVVCIACTLAVFIRPDVGRISLSMPAWARLGILVVLLTAYARAYEPAGFIVATFVFCTALSVMLGSRILPAFGFGLATGVAGFFLCTELLELNLPAGVFSAYL